jgi:hypothetical protein
VPFANDAGLLNFMNFLIKLYLLLTDRFCLTGLQIVIKDGSGGVHLKQAGCAGKILAGHRHEYCHFS